MLVGGGQIYLKLKLGSVDGNMMNSVMMRINFIADLNCLVVPDTGIQKE